MISNNKMSRWVRVFSCAAVVAAVPLFLSVRAPAQEAASGTKFKPSLGAGDSFSEKISSKIEILLETGEENTPGVPLTFGWEENSSVDVLKADGGKPFEISKSFGKSFEFRDSPLLGGRNERMKFQEGRTFSVMFEEGEIRTSQTEPVAAREADLPAEVNADLKHEIGLKWASSFPADPIKEGAEWKKSAADVEGLLALLGLGKPIEASASFKFEKIEVLDGRPVAKISVVLDGLKMKESGEKSVLELKGSGTIFFLLSKGVPASISLKGEARLDDPASGISGKGNFECNFEFKPEQ